MGKSIRWAVLNISFLLLTRMFKKREKRIMVSLKNTKEYAGGVGVFRCLMSIGRKSYLWISYIVGIARWAFYWRIEATQVELRLLVVRELVWVYSEGEDKQGWGLKWTLLLHVEGPLRGYIKWVGQQIKKQINPLVRRDNQNSLEWGYVWCSKGFRDFND